MLSWRNRWYVAGLDRDRGEPRSFRLSRITGRVDVFGTAGEFSRPGKPDLLEMVAGRDPETSHIARIRANGGGAGQLRRIADSDVDGELTITYTELDRLARIVASAGASVTVLSPPELIDAVVDRLRAALA